MVAIFTGVGTNTERGSGTVLGAQGQIGQAGLGRAGGPVSVNAMSGLLIHSRTDEMLIGRGPDQAPSLFYDSGNQGWLPGWVRALIITGNANAVGSTVTLVHNSDRPVFTYDSVRGAYVSKEGAGAYDEIRYSAGVWSYVDGDTGVTDYFDYQAGAILRVRTVDRDGNTQTYAYEGSTGKVASITNADGSYTAMTYTTGGRPNEITTYAAAGGSPMTRVRYTWDANNRLLSTTVDLSPADNSIADGKTYVTTYTYDGTSKRISSISQTDGSVLSITYDSSLRVQTLTETISAGVTRTTTLAYHSGYTTVTDAQGGVTTLSYDAQGQLTQITQPPAVTGAAAQTTSFAYNANGDVISVTDAAGAVTSFQYDSNGNEIWRKNAVGNIVTRTYGARNELLTETVHPGSGLTFGTSAAAPTVTGNQVVGAVNNAWGSATSHQTYTGAAIASGRRLHPANSYSFLGLTDTVLSTSAPYNEYDYAFYFNEDKITIWENGSQVAVPVASGASDSHFCQIEYDGSKVIYRINGAVVREVAASGGRTFHLGVSTTWAGRGVRDITFGTSGSTSAFSTSAAAPTVTGNQVVGAVNNAWGSATSLQTYTGSATVSGRRLHPYNGYSFLGLTDTILSTSAPYNEYDYAFYFTEDKITIWENGSHVTMPVASGASDSHFCQIEYDGSKVVYRINGVVVREVAATAGRTFHFGVSTSWADRGVQDITFAPYPAETTRYAYDSENHLRFAVSAQGEVTEYRYNAIGQQVAELVYAGSSYNVAGLPAGQALSEASLSAWVTAHPDGSSVKRRNIYYDALGQVSSIVSYSSVSNATFEPDLAGGTSADFTRTTYVYDQAGQLLSRVTDGQLAETFVYDGLGRVVASTDVNQGTTTIAFNDAATQTVVTLASGLVTTSTYNKTGSLVSVVESGSFVPPPGTTTNKYDKLGRLRMTTDAAGFNKYFVYDKVGRLVGEVNHNGHVVEYRYDAGDRLIATVRYTLGVSVAPLANPDSTIEMSALRPSWHPWDVWSWRTYDKEGRLTSTMDGTIRTYEYDSAGRLIKTVAFYNGLDWNQILYFQTNPPATPFIPASDARDVITRTFYDSAGREVGTLDAEGYLTRNIYDKAGQLIERRAFATRSAAAHRAAGTFAQLLAAQPASADDRAMRFVYNGQGQLRYQVDALNQVVEYNYNSAGQAISTIRYAGSIAATTDYSFGNVKALVAASGLAAAANTRRSWSVYDASGRLAYAIDAEGGVAGFSYDSMGQVTKTVQFAVARATSTAPSLATMASWAAGQSGNADNRVTRQYYSARGELRFTVDPQGYLSRTDFDSAGRLLGKYRWDSPVAVTDASTIANVDALQAGGWTGEWYGYDFGGPVTDISNAEGEWYHYGFMASGLKQLEFNVHTDSVYTWYLYSTFGQLLEKADASGSVHYAYDGLGNLKTVTDGRNNATHRSYDKMGRLLTETDAAGGVTSYEYNAFGEVTKVTDARGNATTNVYDKVGRLQSSTDALNYVTAHGYNAFGDLLSVTRGDATTYFEYDRLGRVTKTTDAEGKYEQYTLDIFGNRTIVRNKSGGLVHNLFDRRGLLIQETLPMASVDVNGSLVAATVTNKYEYDSRGNRTRKTEAFGLPEQRSTLYFYDKLDRLVETRGDSVWTMNSDWVNQSLVTPSETLKYDKRGRVIERIDPLGARTLYYYDAASRVSVELASAGSSAASTYTAFTYDANGNVLTRRVYGETVATPANAGGAPPTAPASEYRETGYQYDALNRLTTTTVANIRIGAWSGDLTYGAYSSSATPASVTTTLDYDANGNVVRTKDGNGHYSHAYYDKADRKIAEVDREGYLTFYTLDDDGNVTREDRYGSPVSGAAITSNPLALRDSAAAGLPARSTTFTYDRNGRRLSETRLSVNSSSLDSNGLLIAGAADSLIQYTYNELGEVTRKTEANGDDVIYVYDAAGRLTQEQRSSYADLDGILVRPTIDYHYNGLNELTLTRQGGTAVGASDRYTRYTYGYGGRVATMTDASGATYTYYYDRAGNVMRESYHRYKADGSFTIDSLLYARDQLGRVTSQGLASWNGSAWVHGDRQGSAYNAYGDVAQRGVNGSWQEQLHYDTAGRLWKSNSGDGVWRFFAYDGAGNRTLTLESEGADLSAHNLDQAIAAATVGGSVGGGWVDGINATIAVFDKRGQQTATVQPFRELKAGTVQTVKSERAYNAYGEVTSETDARGNVTDFAYNAMGRLIQKQSPTVAFTIASTTASYARPTDKYYYDVSGRMIATDTYVDTVNFNRVTRSLLGGTGHGGSEALVTAEYHGDGGVFRTFYDVLGDARILRNELFTGNNAVESDEIRTYDAMGRLIQQTHRGGLLTDHYAYDLLGQRTKHWNSFFGGGVVETTDYDMQGRVTRTIAFDGDTVTTGYAWSNGIGTYGMGYFGGWYKTVSRGGYSSTQQIDVFGRDLHKIDFAGHVSWNGYDLAGRLVSQNGVTNQSQALTYFNTGRVATIADSAGTGSSITGTANLINATYGYDAAGNRTLEKYVGQTLWNYDYLYGHASETAILQDASITYDALGRITAFSDQNGVRTFDTDYDLAGNIRRSREKYNNIASGFGNVETDKWFTYDSMSRMVVANGELLGGAVVRGDTGVALTYDVAGRRRTATHEQDLMGHRQQWYSTGNGGGGSGGYQLDEPIDENDPPGGTGEYRPVDSEYRGTRREEYEYRADGYLMTVKFVDQDYDGTGTVAAVPINSMRPAAVRGVNARDAMGRVTSYQEYNERLLFSYNRFNIQYDYASRVTHEETSNVKWESAANANVTYLSKTDNTYGGLGGALSLSEIDNFRNGVDSAVADTSTSYSFEIWDEAKVKVITHTPDTGAPGTVSTSTHYYDGAGRLASVDIGARRHAVSFASSPTGQVLRRLERSAWGSNPIDHYYFVDGVQIGELTNNGNHDPARDDYTQTIQTRTMSANTSDFPFRWNGSAPKTAAQFGGSGYDPISPNSNGMQGADSRYLVRDGDTLAGIAAQVWGDSSLWYMIAEANGLSAGQHLAAGTSLIIPDKVTNLHNGAGNFQVYDPNRALGDLSPNTLPPTAAKPPKKANKCGMFGAILLVAIAVAVTVVTAGAALAAMAPATFATIGAGIGGFVAGSAGFGLMVTAGAVGGVMGSIVSQGVGVATGLQDKFSWKAVAMAGISGAVSAGVGASGAFARVTSTFARGALSGATSSALTQGIGVAVGLQKKFDFAGVAAAGLGGGVGAKVGGMLKAGPITDLSARNIGANLASSTASAIANAAARSVIQGTSFGDNIMAALPDVIGSTIGNMIGGAMAGKAAALAELGPRSKPSFSDAEPPIPQTNIEELLARLPGLPPLEGGSPSADGVGGPDIPLDVRDIRMGPMENSTAGLRMLTRYRADVFRDGWKDLDFERLVQLREDMYRLQIREGARRLDDFVPLNLIPLELQARGILTIPLFGDAVHQYAYIETILHDGPGRAPSPSLSEYIFDDGLSAEAGYFLRRALHNSYQTVIGHSSTPIGQGRGYLDANAVRYSQENIGSRTRDGLTMPQLAESLARGWSGEPINVLVMGDGSLTSMDNRRLFASRRAGTDVYVRMREFNEPLTAQQRMWYTNEKTGFVPRTWGQAITDRINSQPNGFSRQNPYGSYNDPTINPPRRRR